MILKSISLQNFRSYQQAEFDFSPLATVIIGPNTAGKSNLLEAIYLLSSGKSFRAEKDMQMISFGSAFARVRGEIEEDEKKDILEVILTAPSPTVRTHAKKFLINGVPKRQIDFAGFLPTLLFIPADLNIIISSPSYRRDFLDSVLELVDKQYRQAKILYEKALKRRNALLDLVKETGVRNDQQFVYWDEILITNGDYLSKKRSELIEYFNNQQKEIIHFQVKYDHSQISKERLQQYYGAEIAAGVTLVGPHRDDFYVELEEGADVRYFGSRGQQRLVVLQLKLLQLSYIEQSLGKRPLLLLDDIFSELDDQHINLIMKIIDRQQTILTTTHKEFVNDYLQKFSVIELSKK
ncbi:MAG: DNA replication and repair protein RecF [Patescibacteria group bacterium]|nr:MAG: DNA replication and repair protein RecF [Patescibacteria group bacterium]